MKKFLCILAIFLNISLNLSAQYTKEIKFPFLKWWEPAGLEVFREAFPDVKFVSSFDGELNDWIIHIFVKNPEGSKKEYREAELCWCEGRFLPREKVAEKYNYRIMLYDYPDKVADPEDFTEEQIERIKVFTSRENRRNGAIDSPYLYNIIFQCENREKLEKQIVTIPFLTLSTNVHQNIADKLRKISDKIMALPRNEELNNFFKTLTRTDGYAWRQVRDTQSRSFHSIGLAIDILPKGYYQKVIYWGWQKQLKPDTWFMTPVKNRWAPPQEIIDIFESEGFIWGGKWMVWDNMHFEYRPELIQFKKKHLKNVR